MRLTYTDLLTDFLQKSGNAGSTDATLADFFKRNLAARYQMMFSQLTNHTTQQPKTAATVVGQQFYHNPAGIVDIENATITISSRPFPLITVDSQQQWDYINLTLISTTVFPQFIFPRRDDWGIWPTPQGIYTITFNAHIRDRSLSAADYVTGTVTVTNNSQTVTGSGVTWSTAMIGRWFIMNDNTKQGEGFWYRILDVPSTSTLTLETSYEQTTVSGAAYKIGESPELPEELHIHLSNGVVSDYFAGPRSDPAKATWFNNVFWTGDGQQSKRQDTKFIGGVLGAKQLYAGRSDGAIVYKGQRQSSYTDRMLASSITS